MPKRAICLLDFDAGLGEGLREADLERARVASRAIAFKVDAGPWQPDSIPPLHRPGTGVLVLRGLLLHEIALGRRRAAELVSAGDLIYPLDDGLSVYDEVGAWRALDPTLFALVDAALVARISPFPSLAPALASRSGSHLRNLALQMLCTRSRRVEDRLIVLFALLAERWGKVCADGIRVPVPLSHRVVAELVAAQRPTVTTAVTRLTRRGLLKQLGSDGWFLCGEQNVDGFLANLSLAGHEGTIRTRRNGQAAGRGEPRVPVAANHE